MCCLDTDIDLNCLYIVREWATSVYGNAYAPMDTETREKVKTGTRPVLPFKLDWDTDRCWPKPPLFNEMIYFVEADRVSDQIIHEAHHADVLQSSKTELFQKKEMKAKSKTLYVRNPR